MFFVENQRKGEDCVLDADKQKEVLRQMLDTGFGGGDSLTELRDRLGIDGETWEAWLREGGMPEELVRLSKAMAEMCAPWVWASLLELTKGGSIPAMKLYFELCKEQDSAAGTDTAGEREILALRQEIFGGAVRAGRIPEKAAGGEGMERPGEGG
ncbi:MAG: hypothetical protein IJB52_11680 [Clostridia bacterium]|nr:hypothetical protein [Clostridia bacterium]